jgi:hypothetical protein
MSDDLNENPGVGFTWSLVPIYLAFLTSGNAIVSAMGN